MSRELKVAAVVSIIAFLLVMAEAYFGTQSLDHRLFQKIAISVGCGFTAWLAMNSWFKKDS